MHLRSYQIETISQLRKLLSSGKKRLILQAVTGAGKTVMAAEVIRLAEEKGKRVLFLAHRRELVRQCSDKLRQFGVLHQVIMVGENPGPLMVAMSNPVQVASKDTLWARAVRSRKLDLPPADLIICDEAHRSLSRTFCELIAKYPAATVIGLTATPARGDGRGLDELYEGMVQSISCQELIDQGFLVPYKVFAPYRPDLEGVKVVNGDWHKQQLEQRMDKTELVGDIVENWKLLANGRQTLVFASGVAHSMHLADAFEKAGIVSAHLDGSTPLADRDDIMRRVMSGDVMVLCNCDVATEGTDIPPISCVVLARPTRSIVRYKQMVGRGMRVWEGKEDCLLLDHSGCVYNHGFPDEDIPWTLSGKEKIDEVVKKARKEGKMKEQIVCKKCHAMFSGKPACPQCGTVVRNRKGKEVATKDGLLKEVERGKKYAATPEERQRFWQYALAIACNKFQALGVAAGMFSQRFGQPPWKFQECKPMPKERDAWKKKAIEVFPTYGKPKAVQPISPTAQDEQGHFF